MPRERHQLDAVTYSEESIGEMSSTGSGRGLPASLTESVLGADGDGAIDVGEVGAGQGCGECVVEDGVLRLPSGHGLLPLHHSLALVQRNLRVHRVWGEGGPCIGDGRIPKCLFE